MDVKSLRDHLPLVLRGTHIKNSGVLKSPDLSTIQVNGPSLFIVYVPEHFFVVYLTRDQLGRIVAELFCSLGKNPIRDYGLRLRNLFTYRYNKFQFQHTSSSRCSLFCLYFCYLRSHGWPFDRILTRFCLNRRDNERIVCDFYSNLEKPKGLTSSLCNTK